MSNAVKNQIDPVAQKYIDEGIAVSFATNVPLNEQLIKDLINQHRTNHGYPAAKNFFVFDSPRAVMKAYPDCEPSNAFFGNLDADWLYSVKYAKEVEGRTDLPNVDPLIELCKHVHWFWMDEENIIVTHFPTRMETIINEEGNRIMHSNDGPAIQYRDGWGVFFVDGQCLGTTESAGK